MTGEITEGYGESGFQATALGFPSAGCWQGAATVGDHTLTFTTQVVVLTAGGWALNGRQGAFGAGGWGAGPGRHAPGG
jgi:hypothetical protein